MRDDIRIFVQPNFCCQTIELYIQHNGNWIDHFESVQVSEGTLPPIALRLSDCQAQDLMDRLWAAGLRPVEGRGSAGALAATERHLEDMRKLVFHTHLIGETP
jgi:hypothetical protein